jgi:hypothetical protein
MESPSKIPNKIDLEKLENSAGSSSFQHTGGSYSKRKT